MLWSSFPTTGPVVVDRRPAGAEAVLGPVGVLVLVDEDVLPAALVAGQHLGMLLDQEHDPQQQVVEVGRIALGQVPLVGLIDLGRGFLPEVVRLPAGGEPGPPAHPCADR